MACANIGDWLAAKLAFAGVEFGLQRSEGDIYRVLETTKYRLCAEVRDRIYSLLTLSKLNLAVRYDEPAVDLLLRTYTTVSSGNCTKFLKLAETLSVSYDDLESAVSLWEGDADLPQVAWEYSTPWDCFTMTRAGSTTMPMGLTRAISEDIPQEGFLDQVTFCGCHTCITPPTWTEGQKLYITGICLFYGNIHDEPAAFADEPAAFIEIWAGGDKRPIVCLATVQRVQRTLSFHAMTPDFLNSSHDEDPPVRFYQDNDLNFVVALSHDAHNCVRQWRSEEYARWLGRSLKNVSSVAYGRHRRSLLVLWSHGCSRLGNT